MDYDIELRFQKLKKALEKDFGEGMDVQALLFLIGVIVLTSCHKDPQLGNPPSEQDASFTYAASDTNSNVIVLNSVNQEILCMWDFGNGIKKKGNNVVASYPYAGTYTITLTVFNKGGSKSSTQQIVIAQDDLSLLNHCSTFNIPKSFSNNSK